MHEEISGTVAKCIPKQHITMDSILEKIATSELPAFNYTAKTHVAGNLGVQESGEREARLSGSLSISTNSSRCNSAFPGSTHHYGGQECSLLNRGSESYSSHKTGKADDFPNFEGSLLVCSPPQGQLILA
jgi:hypothetical protein